MEGFIAALIFAALAYAAYSSWAGSHPSFAQGIGTIVAIGVVVAIAGGLFVLAYVIYDLSGLKWAIHRRRGKRERLETEIRLAQYREEQQNLPPPEPPKLPTIKEWLEKQHKDLGFRGHHIMAVPEAGKTNLLSSMIFDDLDAVAYGEATVIVCDAKAIPRESLIRAWKRIDFEKIDPRLKGRVHLFEPDIDVAINLLQIGDAATIVELLEYCFSSLLNVEPTDFQASLLTECLIAVKEFPQPSIPTLMQFLQDGVTSENAKYIHRLERDRPLTWKFFFKPVGKTTEFDSREYQDRRKDVFRRLRRLINKVPMLSKTICSHETRVDLRELIDGGNLLLINCQTDILGGEKGAEFWFRLWTLLLRDAANHRRKYTPTFLYIDEADILIGHDTMLASLIERCRSARIGIIAAHHGEHQIPERKVLAALQGCGIKFAWANQRGVFTPDGYTRLEAPLIKMNELPTLSRSAQALFKEAMRQKYGQRVTASDATETLGLDVPSEPNGETEDDAEPRPFKYGGKADITDGEFEIIEPEPKRRKSLPGAKKDDEHDPTKPAQH